MHKLKVSFKYLRLSLIFAFVVFLILLCTMGLIFFGIQLLAHGGVLDAAEFRKVPLLAFCIASIIVGTVIAAVFSKKPLRPLREMMNATDKIAAGDYSVRLDLKGPEEFRQLSSKFNHMAEELGSVELLRTDFVNNFSHEFKTPIVSIRGFAKALKWDDLSDHEREEYLDIIISESERLSALSANVLYLSKLEKQSILTDKKTFNVSEQIRLAIALLDQKFTEKNLRIVFDNQEYFLTGNEEMLKQVWINLLDNAIKFSPAGGVITVTISQNAMHTHISISNEGVGIEPSAQAHIFDKFYQADPSHATQGNGLGLSIVKKIVDLHGGTVTVSSDAGTTFTVSLHNELPQ